MLKLLVVPVEMSMVALAGALKVFTTHVVVPPFGIPSGGPKLQPVLVQSTVAELAGGTVVYALRVHELPAQPATV